MSISRSSSSFAKSAVRLPVLMAVAALMAMVPSTSRAATITQNWAGGPEMTDLYFDHTFNQFDDSTLGTLNSVKITLDGSIDTLFKFTNTKSSGGVVDAVGQFSIDFFLSDVTNGGTLLTFSLTSLPVTLSAGPGATDTENQSMSGPHTTITLTGANLLPFLGKGSFTYLVETLEGSGTGTNGNSGVGYETNGSWDVTLEYDYSGTAVVPEPSSLALLGLGGLAMGLYRRFPRRGRKTA